MSVMALIKRLAISSELPTNRILAKREVAARNLGDQSESSNPEALHPAEMRMYDELRFLRRGGDDRNGANR
jgi:hypothetical protein